MSVFFRHAASWRLHAALRRVRAPIACALLLAACVFALQVTPAFAAGHAKAPRPAPAPSAPPPLLIGEINTYKALPEFSTPYRRGWMLALEQLNAEGGVLGRKLEVRSRDDRGDPDKAVLAAQALVEKDGVIALFGGYSSEVGLALSGYADAAKVLYLAVAPLSQRLTWQEGNRYTFRLRPAAWMQAAAVAPKALGLRKLRWALVYQDTESDRATADAFKGLMKTFQSKTEFVAEQAVTPGKFDAAATVAALGAARPEAIFNMLTGRELAGLARAGMAAHLFDGMGAVSLFMGDPENLAILDTETPDEATPASAPPNAGRSNTATSNAVTPAAAPPEAAHDDAIPDGWIITGYPRDAVDTPENQAFVQAYRDRYGDAPGMAAVLGYSALRSIAEGLKRAGSPDREALASAFPRLQVATPFGTIEYRNLDHQSTLGIYLGYTGHADGRLVMERFVYATGARLQPLDEQIRRLRVQAARASTADAIGEAGLRGAQNAAGGTAGAASATGGSATASPGGAVGIVSHPASAHPATGAGPRPSVRPDTGLTSRLRAARPGTAPAAPSAGAQARQPYDTQGPLSKAPPSVGSPASNPAAETAMPIRAARPGTGTQAPAMAQWPDQVGQSAPAH